MLALEKVSPDQYRAVELHAPGGGSLAFGGHLLALLVMAATEALGGRRLTSLHALFGRGVRIDEEASFHTEVVAAGRNAASTRVSVRQGDRSCVDALALALTPQDLSPAYGAACPEAGVPADAAAGSSSFGALEMRVVAGADLNDAAAVAEPALSLWIRPTTPPTSVPEAQAMIAYASEPHFLGIGLRPHAGWSQAQSFSRFIPAVLSHAVHFHVAPPLDGSWWLYVLETPHVADGRVFGRGDVFAEDGTLLASIAQENLMRPVPPPA